MLIQINTIYEFMNFQFVQMKENKRDLVFNEIGAFGVL